MDRDITKIWLTNGTVVGTVTIAEADAALKLFLLLLTCIYTILKIWKLARQKGGDDTIRIKKDT